jgi:lipopolysaccharide export system permease protein
MLVHLYGTLARHIMRQLLLPFLCCFFGFVFLFFINDLQDQIGDFSRHGDKTDTILYFLYILPEKITLITPMALLLGTMYCFSNLNRHSEISAIRSSGISIFRLCIPVFCFSLLITACLFLSNEYLQGFFKSEAQRLHYKMSGTKQQSDSAAFIVSAPKGDRLWNITFNEDGSYSRVSLTQLLKDQGPLWTIDASRASFTEESKWLFEKGVKTRYSADQFALAPQKFDALKLDTITDNPLKMRRFYDTSSHMTLAEIESRLNSEIRLPQSRIQQLNVQYFSLVFTPFACLLSVLLGIPLSLTGQRQGALASSAKALGIMIAYYALLQVFQNLGNNGHLPPFVAGAVPTLLFIGWGSILCLKK